VAVPEPALVVHGHFYQPPRENPWTEAVGQEPSAAPWHDWNERITAECYRANAFARVVDAGGQVVSIVNTYEHLSFDVGPTLLSWLEAQAPAVYERILEGDRVGGGAMAQSYFHVILPLCDERDLRTNVRWGLADFRHRFGRDAEGMWLPETAVNEAVLGVLAEEGVRFTILAPDQAAAPVDPRRAYRCHGVEVVFFDGPLSHSVAFEGQSSQALVERALAAAGDGDGVVCVATDGETFGHHHRYADRALAYALTVEGPRRGLAVTNVAAFLRAHPPADGDEVAVRESAWSCSHGVGRWREDCGCSTGGEPGWDQRWRAPLRQALELLREAAAEVFERRGAKVLADPWAARDAYVGVLLGAVPREEFAAFHVKGDPVEAFTLLEAQRHALAMFTSCGWFFNDLAGIETVYVLRLAARVFDLLRELGEEPPEADFLAVLAGATSNDPREGDGAEVWRRHVLPARVDATRVVAHLALVELLEQPRPEGQLAGFEVDWLEHGHGRRGALEMCCGRVGLRHLRTGRRTEHAYAALHLGGLEVLGATRPADPVRDGAELARLREAFDAGQPVTRLLRMVGDGFGPTEFDLSWAVPDAAGQILATVAEGLADRFAAAYGRLFDDHRATLDALAAAGYLLPPELRAPGELALSRRLEREVAAHAEGWDPEAYRAAVGIAEAARRHGVRVATPAASAMMARTILAAVERAVAGGPEDGPDEAAVQTALELVRLAHDLDLAPDLTEAQELVYRAIVDHGTPALRKLATTLGLAVERLGQPT
jgi:Domain of unknown function (DUF3536)/Glycosyl hydrolase family 57